MQLRALGSTVTRARALIVIYRSGSKVDGLSYTREVVGITSATGRDCVKTHFDRRVRPQAGKSLLRTRRRLHLQG